MNNFSAKKPFIEAVPVERIALKPASPRDSSRLMVVDTKKGEIRFDRFRNLAHYLPKRSVMVFNTTKVLPARVVVYKPSGGAITLLVLVNELTSQSTSCKVMANRELTVGSEYTFASGERVRVLSQDRHFFVLKPLFPMTRLLKLLEETGAMPLPPYLRKHSLSKSELRKKYQTIFARSGRSAAAPTASLHFTKRVLSSLKKAGIGTATVSLDVGLGTFSPVGDKELKSGVLHEERFMIEVKSLRTLRSAKREARPVIAVGTTSLRALESSIKAINSQGNKDYCSTTNIFIRDPYECQVANGLLTNFHTPDSSLIYLVDAFLKFKKSPFSVGELYTQAIGKKLRFYSFGDAMLIV